MPPTPNAPLRARPTRTPRRTPHGWRSRARRLDGTALKSGGRDDRVSRAGGGGGGVLAGARNSKRTPTDGMFRRAGGGCGAGRNARAHHLRVVAVERRVRSGLIPGLGCGPRRVRHLARLVRRASACNLFQTRAGDHVPKRRPGRQRALPGGYDLMRGGPVREKKNRETYFWSADQKTPAR